MQKEISPDLIEPVPTLPKMNILTTHGADDSKALGISSTLVKEWACHRTCAKEFGKWLEEFLDSDAANQIIDPFEEKKQPKRGPDGEADGTPPTKVAKVMTQCIELDAIKETLLHEVKMVNVAKDAGVLQFRSSQKVYIVNMSKAESVLAAGAFVCGFGKGAFKLVTTQMEGAGLVKFTLTSSSDRVVVNNTVTTLDAVIAKQRETKPEAQICYHKIIPDEENPKRFKLECTHPIAFSPKDDEAQGEVSSTNVAIKADVERWSASGSSEILWHLKWTQKGLLPVKPAVHLVTKLSMASGRAFCLSDAVEHV